MVDRRASDHRAMKRVIVSAVMPRGLEEARDSRRYSPGPTRHEHARPEARRDRDRMWYSSSFRRLKGVTQVISPTNSGMLLHDRLTHSLKVAQVARSIAERLLADQDNHRRIMALGGLDADAAEAAALAHDLGHPPFGHIGEEALDQAARDLLGLPEGFEGNAQSFRVITRTEYRAHSYPGMDLTRATRAAVLKYPWARQQPRDGAEHEAALESDADYRRRWRKFGHYSSERDEFLDARSYLESCIDEEIQSLEASVMDVADDITYAIHDLEDFYQARLLDVRAVILDTEHFLSTNDAQRQQSCLARLAGRLHVDYPELFSDESFRRATRKVSGDISKYLGEGGFDGSRNLISTVKTWASERIGEYVRSVQLVDRPRAQGGHVVLEPQSWHEIQIFKELTREFIIERVDLALVQRAQQLLLGTLVELLLDWKKTERNMGRLPRALQDDILRARQEPPLDQGTENRAIIDYICRLTDDQCVALHLALTGRSVRDLADRFVL